MKWGLPPEEHRALSVHRRLGTLKSKSRVWQVMAAVIIEDQAFTFLRACSVFHPGDLLPLMSEEKRCKFEEFHASELYAGYGAFEGIDQDRRLEAITKLLHMLTMCKLNVVYGGVNVDSLQKQLHASADPIDISFRICLRGIRSWIDERILGDLNDLAELSADETLERVTHVWLRELVIVVVDECDSKIKNSLHKTFRTLRAATSASFGRGNELVRFHDDMYFGDSRLFDRNPKLANRNVPAILLPDTWRGRWRYRGSTRRCSGPQK